jgi:predicted enzyme related to lactoylglutathione lyase
MSIVWWEIETPTPEAFQAFHAAMWGWSFRSAFEDTGLGAEYWIVREGGSGIGGLQRSIPPAVPQPGVRLYIAVEDLEATLERAAGLGATVERTRTELGGDDRWFAIVTDPSGVSFGLWTAQPPRLANEASGEPSTEP